MHMADALLSPAVAATMYVASGTTVGLSVKKLTEDENTQKLPTMAVASALVFAGQMINYTIPGTGSSGHMCGGMLLSALLGPQAGFLSMAVVLTIQCLFFADGLMALGANIWNMAFYGCFVGYYLIWRPIMRSRLFENLGAEAAQRARIIAASIIGCIVTLQMGAFSVVLETTLSGITELPFSAFCGLMLPHSPGHRPCGRPDHSCGADLCVRCQTGTAARCGGLRGSAQRIFQIPQDCYHHTGSGSSSRRRNLFPFRKFQPGRA